MFIALLQGKQTALTHVWVDKLQITAPETIFFFFFFKWYTGAVVRGRGRLQLAALAPGTSPISRGWARSRRRNRSDCEPQATHLTSTTSTSVGTCRGSSSGGSGSSPP